MTTAARQALAVAGLGLLALDGLAARAAAARESPGPGPQVAAAVRRAAAERGRLTAFVLDAESGHEIFDLDADEPMIAASNVKLVTTALALEALGPGFQFETRLLARGRLRDGRLEGELAVVGAGDPNLSGRHFEGDPLAVFAGWARSLADLGVREFAGDVHLVHGLFDDERVHPDWPRDQLSRWYEAPVDALSFSDNCVLVRITPHPVPGRDATVQVLPDTGAFVVRGRVATTASRRRHRVVVERDGESGEIHVSGAVLRGAAPIETWVAVADPVSYFGAALIAGLERAGLAMAARTRSARELPSGPWLEVATFRSDLLSTLEVTNRRSQNFYAESLLKLLAARLCGAGTWEHGVRLLDDFLARLGLAPTYRLADGSGMSRANRLSARQLATVLAHMYRHELRAEFLATLPVSGDADHHRWRTRLAAEPYRGSVSAKTGSLRGVSTLSGYASGRSGRVYIFSILGNGVRSIGDGRRAQDRILQALIDHG